MTLESLPQENQNHNVVQLVAVSGKYEDRLKDLGIRPESYLGIVSNLKRLGIPLGFDDLVSDRFSPKVGYLTPFKPSRFTDGSYAVFYSSLEEETSIEEMRYHQQREFKSLASGQIPQPRYFTVYDTNFEGRTVDLFPLHPDHPELTSVDDSGHHFCRSLGREALGIGVDAFITPSARRLGGKCAPVFKKDALSRTVEIRYIGRFRSVGKGIVFERK